MHRTRHISLRNPTKFPVAVVMEDLMIWFNRFANMKYRYGNRESPDTAETMLIRWMEQCGDRKMYQESAGRGQER